MQNETWYVSGSSCAQAVQYLASENSEIRILFLHGRYGSAELWGEVAQSFSPHVESFCLGFPGFGESFTLNGEFLSLAELVELTMDFISWLETSNGPLRVQKQRDLILVGHDLGGVVAQMIAIKMGLKTPSLISGLVLLNSCSHKGSKQMRLRRLFKVSKSLTQIHREKIPSPSKGSLRKLLQTWPGPIEQEVFHLRMKSFPKPVLILWGSLDKLNPPDNAYELMSAYPDAELFQHDRSGHWPLLEYPEWVTLKLKEFFFKVREPSQESA